ncbi:MAG: hypothetical protein RIM84_17150 [Alphaproteobacteria bacterium]
MTSDASPAETDDIRRYALAFDAMGVRVGVHSNSLAAIEAVRERWIPGWKACEVANTDQTYLLHVGSARCLLHHNGERLADVDTLDELVIEFVRWANIGIGEFSPDFVFIHSGAVSWNGAGLLLPGPSFCGKSTLVHTLVERGAQYYSDDLALIDADGYVHAYPRPLTLRLEAGEYRRIPARDVGWSEDVPRMRVALVAILSYRADATLALDPCTPGSGALALLSHTLSASAQTERAFDTISRFAETTSFVRGERAEAGAAADALIAKLEALAP